MAEFNGLEYPHNEVDMEKLVDNNDGTSTYSATSAGKMSVSQLMSELKGPEGDRFWKFTAQNWHGVWTDFFLGQDDQSIELAVETGGCLASTIRIWLSRRRITNKYIRNLLV